MDIQSVLASCSAPGSVSVQAGGRLSNPNKWNRISLSFPNGILSGYNAINWTKAAKPVKQNERHISGTKRIYWIVHSSAEAPLVR